MTALDIPLRLPLVEAFIAVAGELHFGRAAELLGVSQSSISEQIRHLEGHLDVVLFDRSTRMVQITREGEALLPAARRLQHQLVQFGNRAADVRSGTLTLPLRLGYTPGTADTIMPIVVSSLRTLNPSVPLETTVMDAMEIRSALRSGEIDVGLLFTVGSRPESVTWTTLIDDHVVVVMGRTHHLSDATSLSLDQIANVGIAIAPYLSGQNLIDIEAEFLRIGRPLRITRQEKSMDDLLLHLLGGVNLALGSQWQRPGLEAMGLVTVPTTEQIPVTWGLAASSRLSEPVHEMLGLVAELVADTPLARLHGPRSRRASA